MNLPFGITVVWQNGLAKILDTVNVQSICPSQLDQFVAACDVAAVQPSIRDMPNIVLAMMQSDRQSLLPKLSQTGIELWNHGRCDTGMFYVHGESVAD
jgi:hypothetical protein